MRHANLQPPLTSNSGESRSLDGAGFALATLACGDHRLWLAALAGAAPAARYRHTLELAILELAVQEGVVLHVHGRLEAGVHEVGDPLKEGGDC